MSKEEILRRYKDFLNNDYEFIKGVTHQEEVHISYIEIINNSIIRGLGAALFFQSLDIDYEEINPIYEDFHNKMRALLRDVQERKSML